MSLITSVPVTAAKHSHITCTAFLLSIKLHLYLCTGECVLLLVGGTDCWQTCRDAVDGLHAEDIYISPSTEQGDQDTESLLTICKLNLNM